MVKDLKVCVKNKIYMDEANILLEYEIKFSKQENIDLSLQDFQKF